LTLFVAMQMTAKVDWNEVFARKVESREPKASA
jgi:hypothetical protein